MTSKKTTRTTSLTILAFVAGLAVAGYGVFFYALEKQNREATAFQETITRGGQQETRAISVKNFLRTTEKEREQLGKYFVDSAGIVGFIERLERLGGEAGVKIALTSVEVDASRQNVLKIRLTTAGAFANSYHFLSLLEAMPLEMDIKSFTLAKVAEPVAKTFGSWEGEAEIELLSFIPAPAQN